MIKAIFKQIWNQRHSNGWLFAELLIVFALLWFCIDVLYNFTYAEYQSKGYDIDYTYHIEIQNNPTQTIQTDNPDSIAMFWWKPIEEILRRIRNYPEVEAVTLSLGTDAYTTQANFQAYTIDSVKVQIANIRYATEDYGHVFHTKLLQGEWNNWDMYSTPIPAIISEDLADSIFRRRNIVGETFYDYYNPQSVYRVMGVMARQKNFDYSRYHPYIITPVHPLFYTYQILPTISVRIRSEHNEAFSERFLAEMTPLLQIPPFYLFNVQSYQEQKMMHDAAEGVTSYVKGARLIILFFIINLFLGLIGTFWLRTHRRRNEIGLRMAIGASKNSICMQLMMEGIMLLTLAAIPGTIIAVNMLMADITITEPTDAGPLRFLVCILSTWLLMGLMTLGGIWFPARRAMNIQPAEVLHE